MSALILSQSTVTVEVTSSVHPASRCKQVVLQIIHSTTARSALLVTTVQRVSIKAAHQDTSAPPTLSSHIVTQLSLVTTSVMA